MNKDHSSRRTLRLTAVAALLETVVSRAQAAAVGAHGGSDDDKAVI